MDLTTLVVYQIETPRLRLRCWSPEDAPQLRAALDKSDQYLRPWIPFMKDEPRSMLETVNWIRELRAFFDRSENFRFGVFSKDGQLIGENMLLSRAGPNALEIGYLTHLGFEGHGYATEATSAMVRLAFDVYKAHRLEIHHAGDNQASGAIPRRLGFIHEATLRDHMDDTEGELHDAWIWCMHQDHYPGSPSQSLEMTMYDALGNRFD
ncbi:MAG TPA: GNAT family N-acetyltransferase [Xanthomonadales bacterium]|nr:GNAT family N-acetyltransferase [Xanthomonadales bacterium]